MPPCFTFLQGCFIFLVTACSDNVCFCCCAAFSLSPVKLSMYQSCGLCSLFTDRALIEIPSYPRLLTRVSRRLILGCRQKISSVFSFPCALGSPFSWIFHAAITPSAALSYEREAAYLLFLIGFVASRISLFLIHVNALKRWFVSIFICTCRVTCQTNFHPISSKGRTYLFQMP